jgi:hypothetical protein
VDDRDIIIEFLFYQDTPWRMRTGLGGIAGLQRPTSQFHGGECVRASLLFPVTRLVSTKSPFRTMYLGLGSFCFVYPVIVTARGMHLFHRLISLRIACLLSRGRSEN